MTRATAAASRRRTQSARVERSRQSPDHQAGDQYIFDVRRRGFDIDLIQADFEFFAHEHGGTRIDSLSDFGVRQDQCDRIMRIDPQERIRLKVAGHIGRRARKARQMQAKQQATAHCRAGLQHKPP